MSLLMPSSSSSSSQFSHRKSSVSTTTNGSHLPFDSLFIILIRANRQVYARTIVDPIKKKLHGYKTHVVYDQITNAPTTKHLLHDPRWQEFLTKLIPVWKDIKNNAQTVLKNTKPEDLYDKVSQTKNLIGMGLFLDGSTQWKLEGRPGGPDRTDKTSGKWTSGLSLALPEAFFASYIEQVTPLLESVLNYSFTNELLMSFHFPSIVLLPVSKKRSYGASVSTIDHLKKAKYIEFGSSSSLFFPNTCSQMISTATVALPSTLPLLPPHPSDSYIKPETTVTVSGSQRIQDIKTLIHYYQKCSMDSHQQELKLQQECEQLDAQGSKMFQNYLMCMEAIESKQKELKRRRYDSMQTRQQEIQLQCEFENLVEPACVLLSTLPDQK